MIKHLEGSGILRSKFRPRPPVLRPTAPRSGRLKMTVCRLPADIGAGRQTTRPDSFSRHRPLAEAAHLVDFKASRSRCVPRAGDDCILGLDVGSTTTKAVLMRKNDRTWWWPRSTCAQTAIRSSASRDCYRELRRADRGAQCRIIGLGVTGSGRQIAALHALTDNVINEIIAHATAAAWFRSRGRYDFRDRRPGREVHLSYRRRRLGLCHERGVQRRDRFVSRRVGEGIAQRGDRGDRRTWPCAATAPPNFTDQCAAFISSDIKTAGQEGIGREDILAGLVYSICLNYLNRVKGSRPVGKKIFMQGGVCYNRAVPLAMASLMKTPIIVPPDPGLMGAFGVALEVANRHRPRALHGRAVSILTNSSNAMRSVKGASSAAAAERNATGNAKFCGSASTARCTRSAACAIDTTICACTAK